MSIDPKKIAVEYYFGDLQYWKLPGIAANAIEEGHDGPALRKLAGLAALNGKDIHSEDIREDDIDSAFREMGIDAPISKRATQMILAMECATKALDGRSNVFDAATHIRIHLCGLSKPPEPLQRIVQLSKEARNAPRREWSRIEEELSQAFSDFVARTEAARHLAALGGTMPDLQPIPRRRPRAIP